MRKWIAAIGLLLVCASSAFAQDARTVLANASRAIGADGVNAVTTAQTYGSPPPGTPPVVGAFNHVVAANAPSPEHLSRAL